MFEGEVRTIKSYLQHSSKKKKDTNDLKSKYKNKLLLLHMK